MLRAWCEPSEDASRLHDLNGLATAAGHHHGFLCGHGLGLLGGPQRGEGGSGGWAGFRLEETHRHSGDDRKGRANFFCSGFHRSSCCYFFGGGIASDGFTMPPLTTCFYALRQNHSAFFQRPTEWRSP